MKSPLLKKIYLLLFALGFLAYFNTLDHDYVLDDFSVIKDNFVVKQGIEGIPTIFKTHYRYGYGYQSANLYRPLSLTLFAIQWEIAPDNPAFAHFFNVLFYSILLCLLFYFLHLLFKKEKPWLVLICCLLYALHPIHTEVVANIKSIDDILAFSFLLLSMIKLLEYFDNGEKKQALYLSLLFFTLAFFSKESTITFLAVIPLMLILFRKLEVVKAIKTSVLYLIPTAVYFTARYLVLGSLGGNKNIAKIDNLLLSAPDELSRLATAIKIMGLYLWKLVFPHPLMNDYSMKQITISTFSDPYVWFSLAIYAWLVYLLIKSWKKTPLVSFAIGFYLIGMSLYSNLVFTIGTSFGERLLFIPSLGFCLAVAYLITQPFQQEFKPQKFWKSASKPLAITALILVVYGFKTIDRNKAWKDNFTLYSTDVKNCDQSARCHYYHGLGLMKEKALNIQNQNERNRLIQEAIKAFDKALNILPTYSDAYGQRGLAYYRLNHYQAALADYQKAVEYNPSNVTALSNMGSLYFQTKQYQQAKEVYEKAINLNPNHVDAVANYASTLGTLGEYNAAITYFKKAIALKPQEPNYYQMIGITYQNLGNEQLANQYLRKAQSLRN